MPHGDEHELRTTASGVHPGDHAKARRRVALWSDDVLAEVIVELRREEQSGERDALLAFLEDARRARRRA
jgi:hypothetical protein